jgi:protein fantom
MYKSSYSSNIDYSKSPEIIDAPPSSTKKSNINLKTLADQKVGKIQTQKKCKYLGRDEKIDPDQYYFVKDENERLKKEKLATNEKIKKMDVSLANIKAQLIKERQLYDQRLLNMDNPKFDKDYQTTKFENEKLKEQNTKLRTYIQGLQSNKKSVPNFNKSKQKKKKNPLVTQKERTNDLALISYLREEIKNLTEDRNRLLQEKISSNGNTLYPESTFKSGNLTNNNITGYNSNMKLDAKDKMFQLTREKLDEMTEKYEKEKTKNRQLEARISLMKDDQDKLNEYLALIENYKKREKDLELRIEDLCNSPYIQQAEERGNIYRKLLENEKALREAENLIRDYERQNKDLNSKNKELENSLKNALNDKDKYKDECMKMKIANEEKEKNAKYFQEQINLLGQYGGVNSDFKNLLNIMKLNPDGDYSNVNLVQELNEIDKINDPVILHKEINKLISEKGTLGNELDKTKSLLQIQQQINEDMQKIQECDLKKYQAEIKKSNEKISELCKLIDIKNLPKEYITKDASGNPIIKDTNALISSLLNDGNNTQDTSENNNLMDDRISEFSKDENEPDFAMNENAIDVYIGECYFEEGLDSEIGFKVDNMMSFITVDFFIHETQTSNILSGKNPMYNFQLTFRVNVDEHLLNYLESDYIYIEIYYLRDNQQAILGKGKIPLIDLINAERENKTNSRVVNRICPCYSINDEGLKIASIHYKMRTRNPIAEILKWYYEMNKFIRDINPVEEVNNREIEQTMKEYSHLGGKIYEVKILIAKATNLTILNQEKTILPYFYYKFYKD